MEQSNKQIKVGELIGASIIVIGACLLFWLNTNIRLSKLETLEQIQEQNHGETKESLKDINDKLDKLSQGQNDFKLLLERKQDKK